MSEINPTSTTSNYNTFNEESLQDERAGIINPTTKTVVTKQPSTKTTTIVREPEVQETEEWNYRLLGCLDKPKLCIGTFCCPCYTEARNSAYFYEDQTEVAVGYCLGACAVGSVMRWRIRQHKKITGHMLKDAVVHIICPCCALIQENRELYGEEGSHIGEQIDK